MSCMAVFFVFFCRHDEKGLAEGEAALSKLEKEVKSKEAERREVRQFSVAAGLSLSHEGEGYLCLFA